MYQPRVSPKRASLLYTFLAVIILVTPAYSEIKTKADADKMISQFKWKEGTVPLGDGIASIKLQNGYRYLDTADTTKVLSELWGNPPQTTMGMFFPGGL